MRRFLVRRLLQAVVTVAFAATVTFVLMHLAPGDPFSSSLENPSVAPAIRAQWRAAYGLDRPLSEQFVRYLGNVARGDLGWSFSQRRPVSAALAQALPNTLLLMAVAIIASFALGVLLGTVQATRRGGFLDRAGGAVSLFFYSVPDFWLATIAMLCFAYWLPLFPVGGTIDVVMYDYMTPAWRVVDRLHHLMLPALTLTALSAAGIARYQRAAMLDVSHEDFVRTARAKGVPERDITVRHTFRNALVPVITLLGLAFPSLVGGTVFVEKVFAWPGMGLLTVNALGTRDYPLVLAGVVVGSMMVAAGSLIADVLTALADPRTPAEWELA